jgi:hypothetical protein
MAQNLNSDQLSGFVSVEWRGKSNEQECRRFGGASHVLRFVPRRCMVQPEGQRSHA